MYLIEVLMGRVDRVTVEAVDPEAEAVEFFGSVDVAAPAWAAQPEETSAA